MIQLSVSQLSRANCTGYKRGAIRCLKVIFKCPLQWVICEVHLSKFSLHHVFMILDGSTKSPDKFSGTIGSKLNGSVSEWDDKTVLPAN